MTGRLDGKRCLVTGASQGIGREIAQVYADEGARVALAARSIDELERIAADIDDEAIAIECDVRETAGVEATIEECVATFGGLDVAVNNAGVIGGSPIEDTSDEEMEWVIDVNLKGQMRVGRTALPHLVESEGSLVNVSSQLGEVAIPGAAVYCSTKGGIDNLTRQLAVEYADEGVNVNALAPGVVETPMTEPAMESDPDWKRRKLEKIPMNRLAQTEDMRGPAVFLASDESAYVNGHVLVVDGGYVAE